MSSGARNWPFLMLTGLPACATAWMKSVCRHRNAGVCRTSTVAATSAISSSCVHVGQHRHADLPLHVGEDAQAFLHAEPAERRARAAVGLVVRRLEDERDRKRGADVLELAGDVDLQLLRFDDARTGNQEQRPDRARPRSRKASRPRSVPLRRRAAPGHAPPSARTLRWRSSAARTKADEQRMAAPRIGRELGVELAAEEPRMIGKLDHFAQVAGLVALRPRADDQVPRPRVAADNDC